MYNALSRDVLRRSAGRLLPRVDFIGSFFLRVRGLPLVIVLLSSGLPAYAQSNCSLFTNPNQIKACRFYNSVDSLPQGTSMCEQALDSALYYWPGYAEAWHEKSVPYLKRGDFLSWRKYLDKAVSLKPLAFLGARGWCRFKFLRDYEGALHDLQTLDTLTSFNPGQSGDGSYNLYIVMALCAREQGHMTEAFHYFSLGIDSVIVHKGIEWIGLYDYLHRAVTRMRVKDYAGALLDLDKQEKKYAGFAETYCYRGEVLLLLGQKAAAKAAFERAKALFVSEGYHFSDPYCEMQDVVYLEDIEEGIAEVGREECAYPVPNRL
jgi:tetratricopeptide (TPR) repeat protein